MDVPSDREKLSLQYAAENRKNEIALLWSRSLYFWGFITVLLTGFGAAFGSGHKTLAVMAACFGFLASLAWTLANRSSKYWQTVWEKKTEGVEPLVLSQSLFIRSSNPPDVPERWFWGAKQYSPSKLAIALSDFSVAGWVILAIGTIAARLAEGYPQIQIGAVILAHIVVICLTTFAALTLLIWCRSGDALSWRAAWQAIRSQPAKLRRQRRAP